MAEQLGKGSGAGKSQPSASFNASTCSNDTRKRVCEDEESIEQETEICRAKDASRKELTASEDELERAFEGLNIKSDRVTDNDNTTTAKPGKQPPANFSNLPPELRLEIYRHAMIDLYTTAGRTGQ